LFAIMRAWGIAVVLVALAGCTSTTAGSTVLTTTTTTTAAPPADPNIAACASVLAYVQDHVVPTFDKWNPSSNEFDATVSNEMRDEATHLFTLETQATGAPAAAIHDEAKSLTDISIAMSEQDDSALATAADAANSALAALRGTCKF